MIIFFLKKQNVALLALLIFASYSNAQVKTKTAANTVTEQKTIANGTPKLLKTQHSSEYDNVHRGLQDKAGNIWFCTTGEGVYRYDGKLFTQFTLKDGLSSNTVWCVLEDKDGYIWFGTADGITRYDPKADAKTGGRQFTRMPIVTNNTKNPFPANTPDNNASTKNNVWTIMQDRSGKLWFGTNLGVFCYDPQSYIKGQQFFTRFLDEENIINKNNLHLKVIEAIVEDKKGNIWFGSSGGEGICRFDGKTIDTPIPLAYYGRVMSVLEDRAGNIWLGTSNQGAVCYDGKTFTSVTTKAGIKTWVYTILEDKTGKLWFATELGSGQLGEDGGVYRYDPVMGLTAGKAAFTHITMNEGLIHNGVFCTIEDKAGNLWFGTRNTGLCRYDPAAALSTGVKVFTKFSE